MILGRQHADRAGRFGHPISLDELRPEHLDALAQQFERDRRRAIEDIFEPAVIDGATARVEQQHLKRSGNDEEARHAMLFDRIEHPVGIEFGEDDLDLGVMADLRTLGQFVAAKQAQRQVAAG